MLGEVNDQRLVHRFLDRVEADRHLLAIRRRGRAAQKILRATRDRQGRAKRLKLILFDQTKVRLVEEKEIGRLPLELAGSVPEDDVNLVETALAVKPCSVVTTDRKLRDILRRAGGPEIQA